MKMFISPPTETNWTADPDELARLLAAFAPQMTVRRHDKHSSAHSLEWTWPTPDGPVEGSLNAARDCVVLDGDINRCADFAVWFRTLVPPVQPLVFYDESYSADVALEAHATAAELAAPFLA